MAILGKLYKLERFLGNRKELGPVFDYFKQALDPNSSVHRRIFSLPVGSFEKVPLTGDIFALEQVFLTKRREECFIESHRNFIDFQLILKGCEQMEYADIDRLTIDRPYDEQKDLITYRMEELMSKFLLQEEDLAIFFPDDAHIGMPMCRSEEKVYKTVIKFPTHIWSGA